MAGLLKSKSKFDPEGDGYDMDTARRYGMTPAPDGPNKGHWGTRVELNERDRPKGFPEGTGIMLKGKKHKTWDLGVRGEDEAGYKVVKHKGRYYSVPKSR